jgi:glycosyltransferase involved in cell wall biosynthesis
MLPEVTVIIPTYNGAHRMPAVLRKLTAQDTAGGAFEVIVIDNNSSDDTAAVASNDASVAILRARGTECRLIRELRQGATFARIAGVLAARAPLVCFLDDDNLPAPDYILAGLSALHDPGIGLLHRLGTAHFSRHIVKTIRSTSTFQSRYELRRFGLAQRLRAGLRLAAALLAMPAVTDGAQRRSARGDLHRRGTMGRVRGALP